MLILSNQTLVSIHISVIFRCKHWQMVLTRPVSRSNQCFDLKANFCSFTCRT